MEEIFITELKINKVRHLENITIPLDKKKRKHLIITGKNGSGKTSVLEAIRDFLYLFQKNIYSKYNDQNQILPDLKHQKERKERGLSINKDNSKRKTLQNDLRLINQQIADAESWLNEFNKLELNTTNNEKIGDSYVSGNFILAHFSAKRDFKPEIPDTVEKIEFPIASDLNTKLNKVFLKYLVKLEFDNLYWHKNQNTEITTQIVTWFNRFENLLQEIFGDETLELKFDIDTYNYKILTQGREPFDFNTLADGYAAILDIITEIMLRMENSKSQLFDIQGIVIIDEIEAHLHIALQEKILPFLTRIFPKIQFIVSTHSPIILASLENVVIYDLENKILTEGIFEVSYQGILDTYFKMPEDFSILMQKKLKEYEYLINADNLSEAEIERLGDLDVEFTNLSPILSADMRIKFRNAQKKLFEATNG